MTVMRTTLALLAAAAVVSGCGARNERAAGEPGVDAPGILVFSGLGSGSYLHAIRPDGTVFDFPVIARLDTPLEIDYYRQGGILPAVLRQLMK